jgi:hypothetical protein
MRERALPRAKQFPTTDMATLPLGFQKWKASLSKDPYYYKIFDIQDTDLWNACSSIHTLALRPSYASRGASTEKHLRPIIDAADRSTGALGSLTSSDVENFRNMALVHTIRSWYCSWNPQNTLKNQYMRSAPFSVRHPKESWTSIILR